MTSVVITGLRMNSSVKLIMPPSRDVSAAALICTLAP